jgi:hypothetical protein
VDEFTVVMATQNGDIAEVPWTVYLFWALMVILAGASIRSQFKDRKEHLEAYSYKFHANTQFETYKSMRERVTRFSGAPNGDYDSNNESHQMDGDEDEEPLHHR